MAKRDTEQKNEATMSIEMLRKCKEDIKKFGFDNNSYLKFLESVFAFRISTSTVMAYPNSEMEQYREKFTKKNEHSFADSFILDKFKIKNTTLDGKEYDTDYFCPRSFWDYVLKTKV